MSQNEWLRKNWVRMKRCWFNAGAEPQGVTVVHVLIVSIALGEFWDAGSVIPWVEQIGKFLNSAELW